jgi:hypothetical protein
MAYSFGTFIPVVVATFALTTAADSQNNPPAQKTAPAASKAAVTAGPPNVMHCCAAHCGTWMLDKGAPVDKPHYGNAAAGSIVIVEHWAPDSVVMNRTDNNPNFRGTAVLTGRALKRRQQHR